MKTTLTIKVDDKVKRKAEFLFDSLGLDMNTAIELFLKESIAQNGFPFDISLNYNQKTKDAFEEAEKIAESPDNYESFDSFDELMKNVFREK
ncbi:type II toxin-antitoxin system RelB/DinJ family antitoxin [Succinivibrio dextrinosolvens]|uniref:type II toxin-antitoxin system RelB/DinJ family antitoxin n=1 Tax=Succinivibrio dextrinosolvens TaxID=83771 RepID=UPI00241E76F8|nr:type II toxin-antitoxin system RelB/DinJ family antitoxin [Succinivibrio dextrinosolvens]